MGQAMSFGLTQWDVEELIAFCDGKFSQLEIEALYKRFRALDRGHKGYISAEEFMNIPELSINPLAHRLERLFESINFKDFVGLLSAFSTRSIHEDKLRFIFAVYDVDGDGVISRDDMELMLRQLAGTGPSEEDLSQIVSRTFQDAGAGPSGMKFEHFARVLHDADLSSMTVEVANTI